MDVNIWDCNFTFVGFVLTSLFVLHVVLVDVWRWLVNLIEVLEVNLIDSKIWGFFNDFPSVVLFIVFYNFNWVGSFHGGLVNGEEVSEANIGLAWCMPD